MILLPLPESDPQNRPKTTEFWTPVGRWNWGERLRWHSFLRHSFRSRDSIQAVEMVLFSVGARLGQAGNRRQLCDQAVWAACLARGSGVASGGSAELCGDAEGWIPVLALQFHGTYNSAKAWRVYPCGQNRKTQTRRLVSLRES